ncbi:MAG: PEP-CTERM sorting domain-containing protein [Fimbriimonadaceae bacterium]
MLRTIGRTVPLFLLGVAAAVAPASTTFVFANNPVTGDQFQFNSPFGPSIRAGQAIGTSGWAYNNVGANASAGIRGTQSWMQRSGNGSLVFTSPGGNGKADAELYKNPNVNILGLRTPVNSVANSFGLLGQLSHLSFDWYRDSSSTVAAHLHPVLRLRLWDPITGNSGYIVYEGVYNGLLSAATDSWQSVDVLGLNARMWSTNSLPLSGQFYTEDIRLSNWIANYGSYHVMGISVGIGSGWNGTFLGAVDNVTVGFNGNFNTYNFEVTAVPGDPVPEPFTMGLVGAAALAALKRRRQKKA